MTRVGIFAGVLAIAVFSSLFTSMNSSPGAAAESSPHAISWLAAGDSYASGAGLTHTTKLCARATGPSKAWATVAASDLAQQGFNIDTPDLVACSGAVEQEFFYSLGSDAPAEWTKSMGRFDLITFSFGGDDVGFTSIIESCLERRGRCSDANVRAAIKTIGIDYWAFLDRVANSAAVQGGNVVVMGYPEVLEDPTLWPTADRISHVCQGFIVNDAKLIRGWAGDLNSWLGKAVARANALPSDRRNGVHFTFVDPVSGQSGEGIGTSDTNLFEPTTGTRHELCSDGDESWLNGLSPLHLFTRSFHPNQSGESAMGNLAAELIGKLTWPATVTSLTCDPRLLYQAAVTAEGINPDDPGYATLPTGDGAGAYGQTCDDGWAVAGISRPYVGTTDGATLFRVEDGAWHQVTQMGPIAVECNLEEAGVPPSIAVVLSGGVVGSSEVGCDAPDAYAGAQQEWESAVCDSAAQQSGDWITTADSLEQAQPAYAGNPSGYEAAIGDLKGLASIPDTDDTAAQDAEYQAYIQALDTFFNTPGLYINSPSTCPLPSG